jgi:hypothetical protein
MTEHRVQLDPTIMDKFADGMAHIRKAWQADVDELHIANGQVETLRRELNASNDRASNLDGDLRNERARNETLIRRNAYLEAQMQRQYDTTIDARDTLSKVVGRAEEIARAAPDVGSKPARDDGTTRPRRAPEPPEMIIPMAPRKLDRTLADVRRDQEDDGTGLPPGPPAFLRTPLPEVEFARRVAE